MYLERTYASFHGIELLREFVLPPKWSTCQFLKGLPSVLNSLVRWVRLWVERFNIMVIIIIVSTCITKFLIVIGSPHAYLSCNQHAITWVSNYRCRIWKSSNQTPVIGYPRDFHVNYASFNGFLSNFFYSFQNLGKVLRMFLLKRSS